MALIVPNLRSELNLLRADLAAEVLRNIVKDGWAGPLNMVAGVADAFTDQSGISALGGATWDAAGRYLHNATTAEEKAAPNGGFGPGAATYTYVDKGWTVDNGKTVTHIGVYSTAARAVTGYVVERTGANAYTTHAAKAWNHGGTGWEWAALDTPFVVPASGTFYNATSQYGDGSSGGATTAYAIAYGTAPSSGSWTTVLEQGAPQVFCGGVRYVSAAANVSTRSVTFVPGAPATAIRLVGLWEPVDAATLGADFKLKASTDAAGYAEVPVADLGKFDATTRVVGGVVALPAGSAIRWGWDTYNAKTQRLKGMWAQWR